LNEKKLKKFEEAILSQVEFEENSKNVEKQK
jgi:hypothetical protein